MSKKARIRARIRELKKERKIYDDRETGVRGIERNGKPKVENMAGGINKKLKSCEINLSYALSGNYNISDLINQMDSYAEQTIASDAKLSEYFGSLDREIHRCEQKKTEIDIEIARLERELAACDD